MNTANKVLANYQAHLFELVFLNITISFLAITYGLIEWTQEWIKLIYFLLIKIFW